MTERVVEEVKEKKRAALLSVASALALLSLNTFLVLRTGSLGVLSEALHSGLDLLAAIITFLSVRVSHQPTDVTARFGLVWAGETWNLPYLIYADALAALAVAAVILWVGSRLGR